jgi:hypothetical protein
MSRDRVRAAHERWKALRRDPKASEDQAVDAAKEAGRAHRAFTVQLWANADDLLSLARLGLKARPASDADSASFSNRQVYLFGSGLGIAAWLLLRAMSIIPY